MSSGSAVARFADRRDAGRQLGKVLRDQQFCSPVVLALPRGGVPVGYEVAEALQAPLDVFVARKVGAPGRPEFGIGAVAEGSDRLVTTGYADRTTFAAIFAEADFDSIVDTERHEVRRRVARYRPSGELPVVEGADVIVVDDGLATGVTAEAALRALAERSCRRLILAVPVGAGDSADRLSAIAEVVCLRRPENFRAVGQWYDDFGQTSDREVVELLERSAQRRSAQRTDP